MRQKSNSEFKKKLKTFKCLKKCYFFIQRGDLGQERDC